MQNQNYIPIDCGFYDHLEAFATTQKIVELNYLDTDYNKIINQKIKIKDLQTIDKEEFMIFEVMENKKINNQIIKIRLDRMITIDGIDVPKNGESCIL